MRSESRRSAIPVDDAITGSVTKVRPSLLEGLFLGFTLLILQGAFIGMSSGGDADGAETEDIRHLISFAVVLIGTGACALRHRQQMLAGARANLVYFILPIIIIVSTIWSVDPALTFKRSVLTTGVCLFDLYVAVAIGADRLLKLVSTTIVISALASILVVVALPTVGREVTEGLVGDWRGVFPQKNVLGHVMSIGATIELFLLLRAGRPLWLGLARFSLCCLLVVMAHSASSLLSVVLASLLFAFYAAFRRGVASGVICLIVGLSGVALAGAVFGGDASILYALLDRDPSLSGRTDLWLYVMDAIRERPYFGWGYLAFWVPDTSRVVYIQNQIGWPAPNAHNGYLELALSAGLIGLAGFVMTGVWALRRAISAMLRPSDLGALLLIVTIQLLVANLTESFMIGASVFGWNIFSILVLKAGIEAGMGKAPAVPPISTLARAKARC